MSNIIYYYAVLLYLCTCPQHIQHIQHAHSTTVLCGTTRYCTYYYRGIFYTFYRGKYGTVPYRIFTFKLKKLSGTLTQTIYTPYRYDMCTFNLNTNWIHHRQQCQVVSATKTYCIRGPTHKRLISTSLSEKTGSFAKDIAMMHTVSIIGCVYSPQSISSFLGNYSVNRTAVQIWLLSLFFIDISSKVVQYFDNLAGNIIEFSWCPQATPRPRTRWLNNRSARIVFWIALLIVAYYHQGYLKSADNWAHNERLADLKAGGDYQTQLIKSQW